MKRLAALAALICCLALSTANAAPTGSAPAVHVDVLSIVEHPALDAIRDGLHDALQRAAPDALRWKYQSAQGSAATAAQIARQFVGEQPAVIVAITTPAAQAVAAATKTVPVVFSGVTDPVAAKLTTTMGASGTNVTGVSNQSPVQDQIALIQRVVPNAQRVGMVYSPGEANSVAIVNGMKAALPAHGMTLVEAAAARSVDVASAARSLVGKVDVIYTGTDNNVVSSFEALVKVARDAQIPLIASDTASVERGAAAALGIDYYAMGEQTARMVLRIVHGTPPGSIPAELSDKFVLYVNPGAAKLQGLTLPESLIRDADKVVR